MKLVPITYEHLHRLGIPDSMAEAMVQVGAGFTLLDGEEIVAAGGVITKWPGMGELWLHVVGELDGKVLPFCRTIRKMIERIRERGHFFRLQMNVETDRADYVKFAEFLKFQREGLMRKYGADKKDHWLYARIF